MIPGIILLALVGVALALLGLFMLRTAWHEDKHPLAKAIGYAFGCLFTVGPAVAAVMVALKCL